MDPRQDLDGREGGMNTKQPALCGSLGRPPDLAIIAGQVDYYLGERALPGGLP